MLHSWILNGDQCRYCRLNTWGKYEKRLGHCWGWIFVLEKDFQQIPRQRIYRCNLEGNYNFLYFHFFDDAILFWGYQFEYIYLFKFVKVKPIADKISKPKKYYPKFQIRSQPLENKRVVFIPGNIILCKDATGNLIEKLSREKILNTSAISSRAQNGHQRPPVERRWVTKKDKS